MARVTRSSVIRKLQDLSGIQSAAEIVPTEMESKIRPVLVMNPSNTLLSRTSFKSATAAVTVYTAPNDKDFFITFASLSFVKDAACDNTSAYITFVQDGATKRLLSFENTASTVESKQDSLSLHFPLKVDRGTNITFGGTFTVGTFSGVVNIGGFILE